MYTKENIIGQTFYTRTGLPYKGQTMYTITGIKDEDCFFLSYINFETGISSRTMSHGINVTLKEINEGRWSIYSPQYELY